MRLEQELEIQRQLFKMNKKAMFIPMLAIFFLILLSATYYFLAIKPMKDEMQTIGGRSLDVIELDTEAKFKLLENEQTFKMIYYKALDETAKQGGGCEDWSRCKSDAKKTFFTNFDKYLKNLKLSIDYIYEETENKLKFKTKDKLFFMRGSASYIIPHKFYIDFDYDFSIYDEYHKEFRKLSEIPGASCKEVDDKFKELKLLKESRCYSEDKYLNIEIPTQDLVFGRPIIKFKLKPMPKAKQLTIE